MRWLAIASLLVCGVADAKIINTGASGLTGFPRSAVDGKSISFSYGSGMPYLAGLMGVALGGTPGNGTYSYPNACSDATDPPASCPWSSAPAFPSCDASANNKPVCDLACAGAFINSVNNNCMPICNNSGGTCQAGSQVAYAVAEIAAAGANAIDMVVLNFSTNDQAIPCIFFDSDNPAQWNTWMAAITASIANIRTAIDASASPNAVILVVPEARYFHSDGTADQYWNYLGGTNKLVDCWQPTATSSWGGPLSQLLNFVRTEAATYGAIYSDYVDRFYLGYVSKGYSEETYLTTEPAKCAGGRCAAGHFNHFGHRNWLRDAYRKYLLATGATDTDGDGLADTYETNVSGTNPNAADSDGDGCNDGVELGGWEVFGGRRDPLNAYDFFDTNGDKRINDSDINAIKQRVELGIPNRAFSAAHQRSTPTALVIGQDPDTCDAWDTKQPTADAEPTIKDLALAHQQKGHRCDCDPDYANCILADGAECQLDIQCLSGVCGCNGNSYKVRRCLTANTATGGYTADPRKCSALAAFQSCILNADCASGVCNDSIIPGTKICVGN